MTVVFAMAALIALYWAASFYVKKAHSYLDASEAAWDRLHRAAEEVVSDPAMPDKAAAFAAATVMCAGCGCLTTQLLIDKMLLKFRPKQPRRKGGRFGLKDQQAPAFNRVVVNAVYYDSLRAPIRGFLLRRLAFPWLRAAAEGAAPVRKTSVSMMAKASATAIRYRKEGRELLPA